MPHYRITIKLENKNVQEFIIEDPRIQIDFVYMDYRDRVHRKNGAGRVTYFDLVMLAEEAVKHQEDRKEVFNEKNNFRVAEYKFSKRKKSKTSFDSQKITLGDRVNRG